MSRVRANLAALATLRTIEREARPATAEEQRVLARWSGWGAVPEVFDEHREEFAWARTQLTEMLDEQALAAAARSTLNAHYTDAALVQAMWAAAAQLGFTGGQVLEPGCGSGNFIGFAPPGARVTGVELEPVTAGIAAALYPTARIIAGSFAAARLPEDRFDLVIGNVPFGNFTVHDPRNNASGHSIHNYFIVRSLRLARPGGLVIVLTSRYTMDARNPAARREIATLADLAGALRLPGGAHQRAAGTGVVTDLLVLRRREPGRSPDPTAWEQARLTELDGSQVPVNEYFLANPGAVLGRLGAVHGAYRADDLVVTPDGDTLAAFTAALDRLVGNAQVGGLTWTQPAGPTPTATLPASADGHPSGYLQAHPDGTFTEVADGLARPFEVPRTQAAELRALLGLRDTAVALLEAEAASPEDTPDTERLRAQLTHRYDSYARAYGPLNRFTLRRTGRADPATGEQAMARVAPPQGGFRGDPYAPLVYALEEFDPAGQRAAKAAIFTHRVVAPRTPRLGADTPADALAICMDAHGEARLGEIARLLGASEAEAREQLGSLVFDDPQSGRLVPAAEYLSGNVRGKLRAAEHAATTDPRFEANVTALRNVIPRDLAPGEIDARLGAAWIGAGHVQRFLRETLDDPKLRVEHPGGQVWAVRGATRSVLASSTWGTDRYPAPQLAQAILEQRKIEVRDQVQTPGGERSVINPDATLAAQEKASQLAERFADWVWEDPGRAADLARVYNERFNNLVLRSYNNTQLSLPGLSLAFRPRPHQVTAVARMISEPSVLLAHEVGAGKTAEMVIGVTELKRLGLARKPAIIVPNHMLDQFAREWLQLYPQAKVLVARRDDLQGERRRRFVARCATGNWDGIVMSRSGFERIPLSAAEQQAYLDRELGLMREWLATAKGGDGLTVKRLEGALLRAEERLRAKLDSAKDPGVTFEATGIDYLCVDEAHGYKNLRTSSNISDAAIDGAMRASDLDMKLCYLRRRNGSRVVTFATATPIANSVTEAYVMQRYLRPDLLDAAGIEVFDSWAATFGQVVTQVELAPEGGDSFRVKSRFARFRNVPEMLRMWHVFADVKSAADLHLPVPTVAARPSDGRRVPETVTVQPSDELISYVAELGRRAEAIRNRTVAPEDDNMLSVSGDGRRAALDLRLVGLPQNTRGKIEAAATRIAAIWRDHRDDEYWAPNGHPYPVRGSLQLVFCDLGTPGPGWNAYSELRDQLVARGMPRESVRFVHEAKTDTELARLFAACRSGHVAVLVGSTEKMGVGTNVQDRAIALHHLDAPWRPADVDQREGRIIRQGNLNPEVQVIRWITARSFDGYMWPLDRTWRGVDRTWRHAEPGWRARGVSGGKLLVTAGGTLVCACLVLTPGGGAVVAVPVGGFDPWDSDCPVRDVSGLVVPLAGSVAAGGPGGVPFSLVFGTDERASRAVNAYLRDLHETFARPLTLRSYAYDLLRWLRFLSAVGVGFEEAARSDYGDFLRWLGEHGKTGGARRARRDPGGGRLNRVTGKLGPDERWFDPATVAHSRIVLHEFYEFLLDRGSRPLINPVPHSRRRDLGQFRQYPHHNPMQPFTVRRAGRRRFDPPDAKTVPRHLPDEQFGQLWSELCCDRDRAMVKVSVDCGIRPGELLGVRGEDVDWGGALIHVVRKGGRKAQWLPVSRDAVAWIRRYQAASGYVAGPEDALWVTSRGPHRPVGYGAWRAVFNRVNQRLGTNWTPHDLRHTACVRMIEAGMKLHQVQEIMGHEDLATTRRYLRPRLDELIEAQREAQARPLPRPSGPGMYDQADLDTLFGRDRR